MHWVSLKPELEGLIFPSKFYGIAAAGRPIIAITPADGEMARLVEHHGCGFAIDPSNGYGLANLLTELAADAPRRAALGARARAMLDAHFTRRQAFERWREIFDRVG